MSATQTPLPPPMITPPADRNARPAGRPRVNSRLRAVPPPTAAFQGVSWLALGIGLVTFAYTTWYTTGLQPADRFFLYTAVLFSLFGSLSVSKAVRDKAEDVPVTGLFVGLAYVAAIVPVVFVAYYFTFFSDIPEANRGTLVLAFLLATFATLAIAKNTRDMELARKVDRTPED